MRTPRRQGYSLVELMLVIGLLALVAAIAAPHYGRLDETELDRAAAVVANAVRFARNEAVRTGQGHGVIVNVFDQTLKVYRLDESSSPPTSIYDVRDPLSKQLYVLQFGSGNLMPRLTAAYFDFQGVLLPRSHVDFSGGTGVPKGYGLFGVGLLETGYFRVGQDGATRTINVSPVTARVSVL